MYIWLLIIGLYELKLIQYNEISSQTWWVLNFTILLLTFGYFILDLKFPGNTKSKIMSRVDKIHLLKFSIYVIGFLLFIRVTTVWLGVYLHYGQFSAGFIHGAEIYEMSRTGVWSPGIGFYIPVDWISIFLLAVINNIQNKNYLLNVTIIGMVIFLNIALQSRFSIMMIGSIYIGVILAFNKGTLNIKFKETLYAVLVFVGLIVTISSTRDLSTVNNVSGEWGEAAGSIVPSIYYYMSSGIGGLNEYIALNKDEYAMSYTFEPLMRLLSVFIDEIVTTKYEPTRYDVPIPTMLSTWLKFIIDDLGYILGSIFIFIFGGVVRMLEYKISTTFLMSYMVCYVHVWLTLSLSFFSYTMFINGFWYSFITLLIISILIDSGVMRKMIPTIKQRM
jgi:oligosaccharide repeat unit polymerase